MSRPRVLKRRHLLYYLEVYDLESGSLLGHLVDVTTRGIKLISRNKIPINKNYSLKMILPKTALQEQEIHFAGKALWSDPDINPDFYDTGFEITNLSLEERKALHKLIERFGFND